MKRFVIPSAITLGSVLLVLLLHMPLGSLEEQVAALKYRLRGEQRADTNIVIIYIDNEAIRELGYPLRRNFYALMVNALAEVKAKAVGIDVVFENPNPEYPEYDRLLQHTMSTARNVVLASYFDSLQSDPLPAKKELEFLDAFHFPHAANVQLHGGEFHLPQDGFLQAASGVGHTNVSKKTDLPLLASYGRGIVPSFGLELLRVYRGIDREGLSFDGETLRLHRNSELLEIATHDGGSPLLNFSGTIRSFTTYPFLAVLQSYDAWRAGRTPSIPVQNLRDKILLIGIIAEGRTQTFVTPFDEQFPPIGLHATFLDNALHSRFTVTSPVWLVYLLSTLTAFVCAASALSGKPSLRRLLPLGTILLSTVIPVLIFVASSHILHLLPLVLAGATAAAASFYVRHRFMKEQLTTAQSEKEQIAQQLRDKEARVASLERELLSAQSTTERTGELLEEIRRYKTEIHSLTSKADDLEEATIADSVVRAKAREFEGMIYASGGAMQRAIDFMAKIADSEATVLILGESGTGKELAAQAIHKRSSRAQKPFIAVNCGALSENLLESELFGHEKGAFTGAVKDKLGRFELADGGTIFLDEIGEVNESFQLKLLRVLQEGEFERVGGTKTLKVNVRVLAATNKDLKQQVKEKKFREDLYYRLNVLSVELPPLHERQTDIPLLIDYFLQKDASGMKVSRNVLETLQNYPWRGNIRELESVLTRAVLLAKSDKRLMIAMKDLSEDVSSSGMGGVAFEDQILESLREKQFSRSAISETADELGGLNRGTVAEHFRGLCLKAFVEHAYSLDEAVRSISLSTDPAVNDRVRKKLQEYLANIADVVDALKPWESIRSSLRPKTKNLPQKYHLFIEQTAEAHYRNVWKL